MKSLIVVNQDYQRKVSISAKEIPKNELISISGTQRRILELKPSDFLKILKRPRPSEPYFLINIFLIKKVKYIDHI